MKEFIYKDDSCSFYQEYCTVNALHYFLTFVIFALKYLFVPPQVLAEPLREHLASTKIREDAKNLHMEVQ
jgi:hypothetical protein